MSLYIVDIHGDIEGDYEIVRKYEEPRKGHWIKTGDYYTGAYGSIEYVECSCCREDSLEEGDFCPNCGADMREV